MIFALRCWSFWILLGCLGWHVSSILHGQWDSTCGMAGVVVPIKKGTNGWARIIGVSGCSASPRRFTPESWKGSFNRIQSWLWNSGPAFYPYISAQGVMVVSLSSLHALHESLKKAYNCVPWGTLWNDLLFSLKSTFLWWKTDIKSYNKAFSPRVHMCEL